MPEEVAGEEENVGGALGEAAHEVGVPGAAEGYVDADPVALGGEAALEGAADAVEHLELEGVFGNAAGGGEVDGLVEDALVVGGDGGVRAFFQQQLHEEDEVAVD